MDWLLVLALNFSDGGSQVTHTPVPSKEACAVVLRTSLLAYHQAATAVFRWTATCVDLKAAKSENPQIELPQQKAPEAPKGEPGTEQNS